MDLTPDDAIRQSSEARNGNIYDNINGVMSKHDEPRDRTNIPVAAQSIIPNTAEGSLQKVVSNLSVSQDQDQGRSRSIERERQSADQQRVQGQKEKGKPNGQRRPSTSKLCGKCGLTFTGQLVRALDDTFHLECFTCHDCGKMVASKFFPVPDQPPDQYPLCEVDYFRRLDLLCFKCGNALRGSYITALDRKYHIEHFTCSVCPTVFGAHDSYYEHDGNVYCHYHYSTRFAQRCNGCQTAILKQYVEIFRNGQNQHWHPECYMIHKYWNVRLQNPGLALGDRPSVDRDASETERKRVRDEEEKVEEKVLWIWRTLSQYEERSATCISDMLLHVSNGAYVDGVMSARKFILHVDILFAAADDLDRVMISSTSKALSYSREAKLLCRKVVAFFQLLSQSSGRGVRSLGVTQELLSLVTGLAHYLKLLIRICLQGSLKLEREMGKETGLHQFLDQINSLETKLESETTDSNPDLSNYVHANADTCPVCSKPVEDRCIRHGDRVIHTACMKCNTCSKDLSQDLHLARWNPIDQTILCVDCSGDISEVESGFSVVTRLQQYVHLLRVAHARLLATLRSSGALPHTSDDPNLEKYKSNSGHRLEDVQEAAGPPLLRSDTRSKSYSGRGSAEDVTESSYENTLGDIRRLRSTRLDKHLSNTQRNVRTSRIIGGPQGDSARAGEGESSFPTVQQQSFQIIQDRENATDNRMTFGGHESITLDDIPRLVAAEQAKDQRPNANKYARGNLFQSEPRARLVSGHLRDRSAGNELDRVAGDEPRSKRYFSELTALEYFIVRHVAVLSMEPLLEGFFNQEDLLELIERKMGFWGKFGKAFKNDKSKAGRKKGIFGVSLDVLVEKDGAESTDGVGPGALRVPALIQDAISAMRSMDMSMEGVFRKNGNIRRLKEMAETIDSKGGDAVDLNAENPVQVAALLKKFLRELPDPVLTFKLHRLFVTSQKITDEDKRRRVLHLSCCLLPKSHRDTMEVLFQFLNWTASFSVVDEESGSKMDIHNLATVMAPNILFSNNKVEGMEDSFLAVEAIHSLIQYNDMMCQVPEDLQSILNDSSLFSNSPELTTKEILKRYGDIAKTSVNSSTTDAASTLAASTAYGPTASSGTNTQSHMRNEPHVAAPVVHQAEGPGAARRAEMAYRQTTNTTASSSQQQLPQDLQPPSFRQNGIYTNASTSSMDSFGHQSGGINSNGVGPDPALVGPLPIPPPPTLTRQR